MELNDFIAVFLGVLAVVLALWIIIASLKNGIGPVPTSSKVRAKLKKVLPDQVQGSVMELGAGWGGITIALAEKYPDQQIIAIENSFPVWCICRLRLKLSGYSNVEVRLADVYQVSFEGVGLIYCYLFQDGMQKLSQKLRQNQQPLIAISHTFSLPDFVPEQIDRADDLWRSYIYRYRILGMRK